jgi:hypothetical protein
MFTPVITVTALLLAHQAASQKTGGGGKGGIGALGAIGNLLGNLMPGGFEMPNMTGPMYAAEYLNAPGTGKYPAVSFILCNINF